MVGEGVFRETNFNPLLSIQTPFFRLIIQSDTLVEYQT